MKRWMELYQTLEIIVPSDQRSRFLDELGASAAPPWRVDSRASLDAQQRAPDRTLVRVFVWDGAAEFPSALLTLAENENGFHVKSLGPNGRNCINRTQHNNILNDFATRVITPVATDSGLRVCISDRYKSIDDFLDEHSRAKFHACFGERKLSPESLHAEDAARWRDFLVAAHRSERKMSGEHLERWLIEVEEWTIREAALTALRYSEGLRLLEHYDGVLARQQPAKAPEG